MLPTSPLHPDRQYDKCAQLSHPSPAPRHSEPYYTQEESAAMNLQRHRWGTVTPSVLRPKPTIKPPYEHHVYVLEHVGK